MAKRFFLDTNILLYRFDSRNRDKQQLAKQAIDRAGRQATISSQVLQEFYANSAKIKMPEAEAIRAVRALCKLRVVDVNQSLIMAAIDTSQSNTISFWDAMIIEAAVAGGCDALLTEDLNHGQLIRDVRVINPFK